MKNHMVNREEQDLFKIFSVLSEHEKIKVVEDCIRDEQDDSVRQVLQLLLSELKGIS